MREEIISLSELQPELATSSLLRDLIQKIEGDYQKKGYVICQFVINGMPLSELDEERLQGISLSEIESLAVRYETPEELLTALILGWLKEIPHQIEQADALAEASRHLRLEAHLGNFVKFVDNCQFLVDSLISFRAIIDLKILNIETIWNQTELQFTHSIQEGLAAFEKKDFVLLGDVLEYDIADSLQNWFDLLRQIEESLRDENGTGQAVSFEIFKSTDQSRGDGDRSVGEPKPDGTVGI